MGCKKGGFLAPEENGVDATLSDALLFTTMCIIGLPVDVYVKDGSVYSGIFHTACVDDDYAIVLKRAKMIKKGSRKANIARGNFIETLVILSEDLVQVVAKGVMLSADSIPGHFDGDSLGTISSNITCPEYPKKEIRATKSNESTVDAKKASKERLVRDVLINKQSDCRESHESLRERTILEVQGSSSNLDVSVTQTTAIENVDFKANSGLSSNGITSGSPPLSSIRLDDRNNERHSHEQQTLGKTPCLGPTSSGAPIASVSCVSSSSAPADLAPPRSSIHNANTKESKLNPGAKIFSPSALQHRTVTPHVMPTMVYMPDSCPVVPVATAEPEVEITPFASRPSVPVKFVPYNNLAAGNGGLDVQYAQQTIGYMGSRNQQARYAGQYHHLQAATGYVHPNSQNVMVGRLGPLVYMHPVSHDVVQSAVGFSQASTRPLLIPHPVHPPKHQGSTATQALQLYMAPPVITGLQQPFTMPSIPITQASFPVIRPMQVPGSNGFLPNKFA
ncbi:uncharacterized protein LOC107831078 [Nicotiana tabacum]|uniref:Uncharacterized protein LOC107831078 n=1 Tax=Nicotiana tabacum TaxID=4097 RepID=A0A1S4DLK8_TOBAC|nr:uncharacterized protein LOC104095669 [Nicotiana tomentosiformis]XP_016514291.1 PREDICTED: uncharacterized protein LOC107831078 [Nicotiana tabacum]